MPSFIAWGVAALGAGVGGAIGATLIMYSTQIAVGAMLLGSMAMSSSAKRKAERKARAQYNAAQVDRLANFPATVAPRELVLGRVRKGGHVFFRGSVGAQREKFVMLIAIAAHEIDAVEQIWLNDVAVTLDAGGWVQTAPYLLSRTESGEVPGTVAPADAFSVNTYFIETGDSGGEFYTSYQFTVTTPKARITIYRGAPAQTADAGVIADFPNLWTSAHRADGIAYLKCEFFYDETAFPSGLPNVTATLRGARCFDPRTGSTAWTENPALHQRHILTHPYFGKRTTLSAAENARISAAANACDIPHNYGAGAVPMYRSSIVMPYGTAARDGLDDLAQAMAGQWAYAGGEFFVRAGVYGAPVMALIEADLATVTRDASGSQGQQAISISTHAPRADRFNTVAPRIWDAAQGYKQVTLAPVKGAALIAADGAELVQEIEMQAVFFGQQAQHIAGVLMRDSRDPLTLTAAFKLRAYALELFDTITLTVPRYGWAAKEFMVLGRQWTLGGMVQLQLKETAAAIFAPNTAFVASGYADNTALARPWEIFPPASLSATSGTAELIRQADGTIVSRVRVSWPALLDAGVLDSGSVEVQWAAAAPVLQWQSVVASGRDTQAVLTNAPDGQTVIIRARTRTSLAVSNWGGQIAHVVIGKTARPDNVLALTVSSNTVLWTPVADADLAGYLLRFQYGENTWWPSAVALHDGVITESPYTLERPPEGNCTVMVKAIDTSGNESESVAFAFHFFSPPAPSNILLSYPQHPTFPGTIINGSVVAGVLNASSTDSFYEPGQGPMYLGSDEAMYLAGQFAELSYEFLVIPGAAGVLVIQLQITGSYRIEYQLGDDAPLYLPAASAMYTPVDESLYGVPTAWLLWPGSIQIENPVDVRFRVTLPNGAVQGVITSISAVLDVPDVVEAFPTLSIGSGGTRLPITQTYNAIKTVRLTVHSGGTATSARLVDKDFTLGPLVQTINSSGTAVAGVVDAEVFGF